jgi:hypothetical protein
MPKLFIDRITMPHDDNKSADDALNEFLDAPQQYNVVAVQYVEALYPSGNAVLANRPHAATYLLTRTR